MIHRRTPWKTREAVELGALERVSWFNNQRLLAPIGHLPPSEAEANYYEQLAGQSYASGEHTLTHAFYHWPEPESGAFGLPAVREQIPDLARLLRRQAR